MDFEEGRLGEDFLAIRALVRLPVRVSAFVPNEIRQVIGTMPAIQTHVFFLETFVAVFFHVVCATGGFAFPVPFPGTERKRGLQPGSRGTWRNGSWGAFG